MSKGEKEKERESDRMKETGNRLLSSSSRIAILMKGEFQYKSSMISCDTTLRSQFHSLSNSLSANRKGISFGQEEPLEK